MSDSVGSRDIIDRLRKLPQYVITIQDREGYTYERGCEGQPMNYTGVMLADVEALIGELKDGAPAAREALLSDAAVEAAAMTYEPDTFIGDAPNADDALRDARAVLEAALAAADREAPDGCRAPHCWSEYGTPCGTCPAVPPVSDEPKEKP